MSKLKLLPLDFEINPESLADGLTQSEMQTWDNCAEKWYLGYNLMLHKQGKFSWPLAYGGWIHGALEEFYTTRGKRWSLDCKIKDRNFVSHESLADEDYWKGVAEVQMACYASHFKHDCKIMKPIAVEEIIDFTFEGIRLKGMVDIFAQDLTSKKPAYYVWDHKTTGRIDKTTVFGWDFRFQFMFYCWLATKIDKWKDLPCKGFIINAIKKPQLRQGTNETLNGFLQRLQIDMQQRPENYYYREKLLLKTGNLDHFENQILRPKLNRIKLLHDPKVSHEIKTIILRNKNTDHCVSKFGSVCEFLPACQYGLEIEGHQFRKRENKHQELMSETTED